MESQTFTITFGDQAENHVGMQKIGQITSEGFNLDDLNRAKIYFEENGVKCKIIDLKTLLPATIADYAKDAYIFVANGGLDCLIKPHNGTDFFMEQVALPKDTKALMYGRVVNKRARHNLCFDAQDQEPNYEQGKGRIISFNKVPLLNNVREKIPLIIGDKGENLVAEGNYYYDITKCGIGFHGDSERKRVIGIRLGATMPLHYQWFQEGMPIGSREEIMLNHGDIYIMSEKAVGSDWKRRNRLTLRHAAGAKKYLTTK